MSKVDEAVGRAIRKLENADDLAAEFPGLAASQAYNAMLAASEAHLASNGLEVPRTHKGVQTNPNRLYHEAGTTDKPAKELSRAYSWKEDEDYGRGSLIGAAEVADAILRAKSFVERVVADAGIDLEQHRDRLARDDGPSAADQAWLAGRGGHGR